MLLYFLLNQGSHADRWFNRFGYTLPRIVMIGQTTMGTTISAVCPGCGKTGNYPSSIVQLRCAQCGMIFSNVATSRSALAKNQGGQGNSAKDKGSQVVLITAVVVVGSILLLAGVGAVSTVFLVSSGPATNQKPDPVITPPQDDTKATDSSDTGNLDDDQPVNYRIIRLSEEMRKKVYLDYRSVARTTLEKPLPLPQGSPPRQALEDMLQKTFDREIMRFAALHRISVEDIHEVIKEGDAKQWDPSPRSNATRNGKRLYPEEMSRGWKPSANIR